MKQISIDELKKIQLEILVDVDSFCRAYGIHYSLAYGTLIGAVRHKGYIPWDDDIDIIMPRADYERFLSVFTGYYEHLSVVSPYTSRKYYAPYANVINNKTLLIENVKHGLDIGVKIDVFPVDNVPNDKSEQIKLFTRVKKLSRKIGIMTTEGKGKSNGIKARLFYLFAHLFLPFISYARELNKYALKANSRYSHSNYVNNIVWCAAKEKGCFLKEDMQSYIDVSFEGRNFKALVGYDDFLKAHYGDYMKLPPEKDRITHHSFDAYWK